MLARARGATKVIGADVVPEKLALAKRLGLADLVAPADEHALERIREAAGRQLAVLGTRRWGRIVFVGEGGSVELNPSPDLIHDQKTVYGSWVTNLGNVEDLVERMPRWGMHPDVTCTHRFPLAKASEAYRVMDEGKSGRVAIVFDE